MTVSSDSPNAMDKFSFLFDVEPYALQGCCLGEEPWRVGGEIARLALVNLLREANADLIIKILSAHVNIRFLQEIPSYVID